MPRTPRQELPALTEARQNALRTMQRVEAKTRHKLHTAVGIAAKRRRKREAIKAAVTFVTHSARLDARNAARRALNKELGALSEYGLDLEIETKAKSLKSDRKRALYAGAAYAGAVMTSTHVKSAGLIGISTAVGALSWQLDRIAATETADAFNYERKRALRPIREVAGGFVLAQWWDASGDRRTCPICESADGAIIPPGASFKWGDPGRVHPNCRCMVAILPVPIFYDYDTNLLEAA